MKLGDHRRKKVTDADFRKKNPLGLFLAQNGPKSTQNEFFWTLKEIESLIFSDFLHEVKGLAVTATQHNTIRGKKWSK